MTCTKIIHAIFRIISVADFLFANYLTCGGETMFHKEEKFQVSQINHWNHGWHILKSRSSSQERWRPRLASHTASRGWCTRKQEFVSFHRAKTLITWNDNLICCEVFWFFLFSTPRLTTVLCFHWLFSLMFYLSCFINFIYCLFTSPLPIQTTDHASLLIRKKPEHYLVTSLSSLPWAVNSKI